MKTSVSILGLVCLLLIAGFLTGIAYFIPRETFIPFFSFYTGAFILFLFIYHQQTKNKIKWSFKHILFIAIALRLLLLLASPQLSNDFFRFIWDGELLAHGINPFSVKPDEALYGPFYDNGYMRVLYHGMGELSQSHYSCYPVLNQFFFLPGAYFFDSIIANIITLRLIIILFDIIAIIYAKKIMTALGLSVNTIWLYALNPFIILEFTGNLHFEGVMIAFILVAIYHLIRLKWLFAGFFMALAIHVKLTPLMLIPFMFKKLKWRFSLGFTAVVMLCTLLIGGILLNEELMSNMLESVGEYFVNFEFNAGLFYLGREISIATIGWDTIRAMGPVFSIIATVCILLVAVLKAFKTERDILVGLMFAYVIYYGFATTIHPWYISLPLIFSIFTPYRFPLLWSFLVMLSYSAYGPEGFKENLYLISLEYILVVGYMLYESKKYSHKGVVALQFHSFFKEEPK